MKASAIIIAIVLAVSGFFITRNMTSTIDETLQRADRTLDLVERLEGIISANTLEIDLLLIQLTESDRKIDSLTNLVSGYAATIDGINKQISELPAYELPEISYVEPEDYQECLQALSESRNTSEQLIEIVEGQQHHIGLLEAKILNQEHIIAIQGETIDIQKKDIQAAKEVYDDVIREAKRQKWLGYALGLLGLAAALLL